jgi:sarcosine dehydrogenase
LYDELLKQHCVYQHRHGFERPGWFLPGGGSIPTTSAPLPYDFYGAYPSNISGLNRSGIAPHVHHLYHDLINGECTFGWPASFDLVKKEVFAARNGAVIFDQSYFGKFHVKGPDAQQLMDWMCCARMDKGIGSVTYTALCNQRGGTEADLTITKVSFISISSWLHLGEEDDELRLIFFMVRIFSLYCHSWLTITSTLRLEEPRLLMTGDGFPE